MTNKMLIFCFTAFTIAILTLLQTRCYSYSAAKLLCVCEEFAMQFLECCCEQHLQDQDRCSFIYLYT